MWIENEINNNKSLIRTRIKITTVDKSEEEIKKKNQPKTYRVRRGSMGGVMGVITPPKNELKKKVSNNFSEFSRTV
jgi:hypothetical protein